MEIYFRIGKDKKEHEIIEMCDFDVNELKYILDWEKYNKDSITDKNKLDLIRGLVDEYEIKLQGIRVE